MNSTISNIQKFSIHDGPGIRTTVFMKGCPLRCLWCQNPETQMHQIQYVKDSSKCIECGCCERESIESCIEICPAEALHIFGKEFSTQALRDEILKDKMFYESSGGGVTISGGEPLFQKSAVIELLECLKAEGIHVALDTAGYGNMDGLVDLVDLYLYDV